jgi:hypothetical protein
VGEVVKETKAMKLRLLLMGCTISAIEVILLATRGLAASFAGLPGAGRVSLVLGLLWK